jgi:hypothetical protein
MPAVRQWTGPARGHTGATASAHPLAQPPTHPPAAPPPQEPLGDLFGGGAPAPAPAAAPAPIVAFDNGALRVAFAFARPPGEPPGTTAITATYTNNGLADIEGFSLQVGGGAAFWGGFAARGGVEPRAAVLAAGGPAPVGLRPVTVASHP